LTDLLKPHRKKDGPRKKGRKKKGKRSAIPFCPMNRLEEKKKGGGDDTPGHEHEERSKAGKRKRVKLRVDLRGEKGKER